MSESSEKNLIDCLYNEIVKRGIEIKTIFDVGAFQLDESIYLSALFPEAKIKAFEPNPDNTEICVEKSIGTNIEFYPIGLASRIRKHSLNIIKEPKLSSFFEINYSNFENREDVLLEKIAIVDCIPLDHFGSLPDLLFMDAQGSEYEILYSCKERLKEIKCICIELSNEGNYIGHKGIRECDELLKDDFDLVFGDIEAVNFDNFIYIRKDLNV